MAPAKRIRVETEVVLVLALENGNSSSFKFSKCINDFYKYNNFFLLGNQLHGTFKPSTTLFEVLTTLLSLDDLKVDSNPVVIYMRRSIQGENALKETTLKNLGLTGGRAMLRLLHRSAEQLNTSVKNLFILI